MANATLPATSAPDQSASEQWSEIAGYPGYQISTLGRVQTRRHRNGLPAPNWRDLKPVRDGQGYPQVRLYRRGEKPRWFFISRLVLTAFVGPPPFPEAVARHIHDRDPWNCRLENLAWGTQSQNCQDKERHGTAQRGTRHPGYVHGLYVRARIVHQTPLTPGA